MSSMEPQVAPDPVAEEPPAAPRRGSIVESVLDNLSIWTAIAAAVTLLYLVWATIDILNFYTGPTPSVGP